MENKAVLDRFVEYGQLLALFSKDKSKFISLGNNCLISYYLKDIGLKKESYPFDWVFSSAEVVESCIKDSFSNYLDVDMIKPSANKKSAGHLSLHQSFFNHRNPLADNNSFAYYERKVKRFLYQQEKKENLFLVNIIKNPEQRPGWANGFYTDSHLDQNYKDYLGLCDLLPNGKFIFFEIYTDAVNSSVELLRNTESYIALSVTLKGKSDGVCFKDRESDYLNYY